MFWENIMAMCLVSSFSSAELPLIGPGGWQCPHLCPDAFKTLAGGGRPITEGGQRSSAFSVGRAMKAGEMAPSTTLAHPWPGSRGDIRQKAAGDNGVIHILQGNCPDPPGEMLPAGEGLPLESVLKSLC